MFVVQFVQLEIIIDVVNYPFGLILFIKMNWSLQAFIQKIRLRIHQYGPKVWTLYQNLVADLRKSRQRMHR
jgi:hypothetical protein